MYCDTPLIEVHAIPGESEQLDSETVLIFPRGTVRARVEIPEEMRFYAMTAHTRSRWARIGMQVAPVSPSIGQSSGVLAVLLSNWSPSHSLIVRTGNTIALAPYKWTELYLRLVETIPLTAGTTLLRIKEAVLPKRKSVPFFDPHEMDTQECIEIVPYDVLKLKKHDFVVIPVCERPLIPLDEHIGFITSAVKRLLQNSAQYDYAGSDGTRVMEFKALGSARIDPGMHIGDLSIYRTPSPLPTYQGVMGKRESIMPFPWT